VSGIAGVALREESQDPGGLRETLRSLLSSMAHRGGVSLPASGRPSAILREAIGHGQGASWADAHCGLGAQLLPRTPEDAFEAQPLQDPASGCVLVWDGRLDNRDELAAALESTPQAVPDSALVLKAFLRWQEGCAVRLLGDFAFAIWDPRQQMLFAARDPMGVRPLFYVAANDRLAFASEVRALLRIPGVDRSLDEVMVGEALLWWTSFPDVERTFFRAVRRLPPAHWLRWDAKGLRIERYWDIDPRRELRYRRHEEYVQQYSALLRQAVACRLRANCPVAIFLSGGMDSSSVASLAGSISPAAGARAYHLQLAGDENIETQIASEVAQRAGIPLYSDRLREENVLDELESCIRLNGVPTADLMFPNDLKLAHKAAQEGCGTLFTGDGSDEVFAFAWAHVADLIRSLRWLRLARNIAPYARYHGHPPRYLLKQSLRYLPPPFAMRVWKRWKWRTTPVWIAKDFAQRTNLLARVRELPARRGFSSLTAEEDYTTVMRGRRVMMDERRELEAAHLGLSYRFPFYDRRMLEFMLAVPWDTKVDGWKVKPFLREAPGVLPESLQQAEQKAIYDAHGYRLWQAQDWKSLGPLFESPPKGAAEYLDLGSARAIAQRVLENGDRSQKDAFLRLAVFLLWLRVETEIQ